jgi:phasin family protein
MVAKASSSKFRGKAKGQSLKAESAPALAAQIAAPAQEAPVIAVAAPVPQPEIEAAPQAEPTVDIQPTPVTPKEPTMTTIPSFDLSVFQTAFSDLQEKAKASYEKSTAAFGDYSSFAKGNAEAVVEAGKIFAAGLQELSNGFVAESRTAFETLTTEVKELAAAKSPTDFFKLHSDLARKHFDQAVATGSKSTEAVIKLATEAVAPLTERVTAAVEKLHKAN